MIDTDNAIISSIRKALADKKMFDDRVSVKQVFERFIDIGIFDNMLIIDYLVTVPDVELSKPAVAVVAETVKSASPVAPDLTQNDDTMFNMADPENSDSEPVADADNDKLANITHDEVVDDDTPSGPSSQS